MDGKFTLSDDSHGIAQVGLNFARVFHYLKSLGVKSLYYLEREAKDKQTQSKSSLLLREVPLGELDCTGYPFTPTP